MIREIFLTVREVYACFSRVMLRYRLAVGASPLRLSPALPQMEIPAVLA
ncbi:MAG: hypothetical protein HS115_19260 [Spirochaetales bacterium]|nr:hypothetical protein [Spirochaetales bacterium]